MECEGDNTTNGKNPRKEEETTASPTREECLEDAFNTAMEESGAAADYDGEYVDDTSFDAQLDRLDWDSGDDPFDAREWQIIRDNLEP